MSKNGDGSKKRKRLQDMSLDDFLSGEFEEVDAFSPSPAGERQERAAAVA